MELNFVHRSQCPEFNSVQKLVLTSYTLPYMFACPYTAIFAVVMTSSVLYLVYESVLLYSKKAWSSNARKKYGRKPTLSRMLHTTVNVMLCEKIINARVCYTFQHIFGMAGITRWLLPRQGSNKHTIRQAVQLHNERRNYGGGESCLYEVSRIEFCSF